jgi:hypothetical protein
MGGKLIYSAITGILGVLNVAIGFWEYQMNKIDFIRSNAAGIEISYGEGLLFESAQLHSSIQFGAGLLVWALGMYMMFREKSRNQALGAKK